ncbi:hypothetical protein C7M84_022702 [Penaeus vannamei]|uniref:Uncharacterized protein n=1 Tax=Penaeus vannamei TaxID=6689 RepID=A0A3R7T0G8_PENVA|nr:hypothetical protein C7M84_022702 [Penaeus vannamei]
MVERLHRHIKQALTSSSPNRRWVDQLPHVLLNIRTSFKEDLQCTSAEMVYGTTLALPADFLVTASNFEPGTFGKQLCERMARMKMLLLLALAVLSCVASPASQILDRTDITAAVNLALKAYLTSVDDPLTLNPHIEYKIDAPLIADVLLTMDGATLGGVKDVTAENCDLTGSGPQDIELNLRASQLALSVPGYSMNGTVVDHIPLEGAGQASIVIEDLVAKLVGKGTATLSPFSVTFTEIALDLELFRWTQAIVEYENADIGQYNETVSLKAKRMSASIYNSANNTCIGQPHAETRAGSSEDRARRGTSPSTISHS